MRTDALEGDLALLQVSDSFFPAGLYSMSGGLEALHSQGRAGARAEVEEIVRAQLEWQVGPCDCVAAMSSHALAAERGVRAIRETDELAVALKASQGARDASVRSGAQALKAAREIRRAPMLEEYWGMVCAQEAPGSYPVVLGVSFMTLGASAERAALSMAYGHAVSVIGAALRLGAMDHLEGQRTLGALWPDIARAVSGARGKGAADMWQFAPDLDICQMGHERAEARMFTT